MILLWGISEDSPLAMVREALAARGADYRFIDQFANHTHDCQIDFGDSQCRRLRLDDEAIDLDKISAVYLRPYSGRRIATLMEQTPSVAAETERFDDILMTWAELCRARVVNRPSSMASNGSKPLQALLARRQGFDVPETLLTSDSDAAREFRSRHGGAIYKSSSGVRSRVARLTDDVIRRLQAAACPLQLQAHVDGLDWRVHVVGGDVFACTIRSHAVDYRYVTDVDERPEISTASLPADIAEKCLNLARSLDFLLTGIDLRQTSDGRWICFEANPSPGFSYYEQETGAPIASAVADLLAGTLKSAMDGSSYL